MKNIKRYLSKLIVPAVFILVLVVLISWVNVASARINNRTGDEVVATTESEDNVLSRLTLVNNSTATSTGLVDLSDTTNFKHVNSTGSLQVSQIAFDWVAPATATSSTLIKVGVIASTTSSGALADIYYFAEVGFSSTDTGVVKVSDDSQMQRKVIEFSPSLLKTALSSGAPSKFVTNDKALSSTQFATATPILYPSGYTAPAVGDIVMRVYSQTGSATTSVSTLYKSTE